MISILQQLGLFEILLLSLGMNILLYLFSIGCYYLADRFSQRHYIQTHNQTVTRKDLVTSLIVLLCNALVFVIGVQLWRMGTITVTENSAVLRVVTEVFIMIMAMDFLMYVFHRAAHLPFFYRLIHGRHHDHTSTNAISLFVMHPVEAIGFGLTFILVLCCYSFSTIAIAAYVFINLLWGTIGHLNKEVLPARWSMASKKMGLGTTLFHNRHHQTPGYNFGFYTTLWDKLFGTEATDQHKQ